MLADRSCACRCWVVGVNVMVKFLETSVDVGVGNLAVEPCCTCCLACSVVWALWGMRRQVGH